MPRWDFQSFCPFLSFALLQSAATVSHDSLRSARPGRNTLWVFSFLLFRHEPYSGWVIITTMPPALPPNATVNWAVDLAVNLYLIKPRRLLIIANHVTPYRNAPSWCHVYLLSVNSMLRCIPKIPEQLDTWP